MRGEDLRGQAVDLTQVSPSDGRFGFTNLVGGNYRLTYERANYETFDSTVFTVASGAAMNVPDVVLRIGRGEIAGSVRLAASAIPGFVLSDEKSGVVVTLRDENGAEVASTLTDASGSYRFSGVAVATVAGRHEVTATREHFAAAFAEVTVEANATTSVAEIILQLQPGALAGHAYPNNGVNEQGRTENMGGVEISVSGVAYNGVPFNKAGASSAAADGSWIRDGLPPGTYEVHASSPNRRCQFKDGARPEL
ncbi:MAG: MSCRAMM family protein [Myxococcales bacterium]